MDASESPRKENRFPKPAVVGSIPTRSVRCGERVSRWPHKPESAGSTPAAAISQCFLMAKNSSHTRATPVRFWPLRLMLVLSYLDGAIGDHWPRGLRRM